LAMSRRVPAGEELVQRISLPGKIKRKKDKDPGRTRTRSLPRP
jgi:hypothetical protein